MSVRGALDALSRDYPGLRFRGIEERNGIRQHIRFLINGEVEWNLNRPPEPAGEMHIVCALSLGQQPSVTLWNRRG